MHVGVHGKEGRTTANILLGSASASIRRNRGSLTIFSGALHYDVPSHISSRLGLRANEP
jgi:hypothetical protein